MLYHSQQLTLTNNLVNKLSRLLVSQNLDEKLTLAIVCLACLARRRICPSSFCGSPAHELIECLKLPYGHSPLRIDHTEFGNILTQPIALFLKNSRILEIKDKISEIIFQAPPELFSEPLLPGWSYQCLLKSGLCRTHSEEPGVSYRNSRAQDVSLSHLNTLTQWFTPQWITQFLVQETIASSNQNTATTFFDPACGAGHVLIEALKQLVKNRVDQNQSNLETVLQLVLKDELFGTDIDAAVVDLAGFSIYLISRDLIPRMISFPIPHFYSFSSTSTCPSDMAALGSLYLGVDKIEPDISLTGLDGRSYNVDVLPKQSNAVATNPPYLSHRLMPPLISRYLKEHYRPSSYDLYAAFLDLGVRLARPGGKIAMICQQSFLSIQRYAKLRSMLSEVCDIQAIIQLGPGSFATKNGEKVNNAVVVLFKRESQLNSRPGPARCWRMLTKEEKQLAEKNGITQMPHSLIDSDTIKSLRLSSAPFAFWCPSDIAALFHNHPPLQSKETEIFCVNGLFTCDNRRFLRTFLELEGQDVKNYVPYDKGGGQKWFYLSPYKVYWKDKGEDIRKYRLERGQSASLPGERYYFRPGVTYSYIGTRGFKARLLSDKAIFDIASSAIFSSKVSHLYILGFLNSALARFLLGVLNPTINYQIGDIRRLPFCNPPENLKLEVIRHVHEAVALARELQTYRFDSPLYEGPALLRYLPQALSLDDLRQSYSQHVARLTALNEKEQLLQSHIDKLIFTLYHVSPGSQVTVKADPWVVRGHEQLCKIPTFKQCLNELCLFLESRVKRDVGIKERLPLSSDLLPKMLKLGQKIG